METNRHEFKNRTMTLEEFQNMSKDNIKEDKESEGVAKVDYFPAQIYGMFIISTYLIFLYNRHYIKHLRSWKALQSWDAGCCARWPGWC